VLDKNVLSRSVEETFEKFLGNNNNNNSEFIQRVFVRNLKRAERASMRKRRMS